MSYQRMNYYQKDTTLFWIGDFYWVAWPSGKVEHKKIVGGNTDDLLFEADRVFLHKTEAEERNRTSRTLHSKG